MSNYKFIKQTLYKFQWNPKYIKNNKGNYEITYKDVSEVVILNKKYLINDVNTCLIYV